MQQNPFYYYRSCGDARSAQDRHLAIYNISDIVHQPGRKYIIHTLNSEDSMIQSLEGERVGPQAAYPLPYRPSS